MICLRMNLATLWIPPGELKISVTRCCKIPATSMSFVLFASKNLTMPKSISLSRSRFSPSFIKPNRVKSFFELTASAQVLQTRKLIREHKASNFWVTFNRIFCGLSRIYKHIESIQKPKLVGVLSLDQVLSGRGQTEALTFHRWSVRQLQSEQSFQCKISANLPSSSS